uniref:Uncharacterized protein n=1 Tax=Anguilla anguilla TaxID=7936 RepID=A0A0E9Q604_ANGAN
MEVLSFCSRKPKGYYFEAVEVAVVFIFKITDSRTQWGGLFGVAESSKQPPHHSLNCSSV